MERIILKSKLCQQNDVETTVPSTSKLSLNYRISENICWYDIIFRRNNGNNIDIFEEKKTKFHTIRICLSIFKIFKQGSRN